MAGAGLALMGQFSWQHASRPLTEKPKFLAGRKPAPHLERSDG
jgi:hypothetical protein